MNDVLNFRVLKVTRPQLGEQGKIFVLGDYAIQEKIQMKDIKGKTTSKTKTNKIRTERTELLKQIEGLNNAVYSNARVTRRDGSAIIQAVQACNERTERSKFHGYQEFEVTAPTVADAIEWAMNRVECKGGVEIKDQLLLYEELQSIHKDQPVSPQE